MRSDKHHSNRYRNSELAKIHIAKKELDLDDDTYREILRAVGGVESSKDLSPLGRAKVLEYLKTKGFTGKKAAYPGRPNTTDGRPQLKKIEALLAEAKRPWSYAVAIAEQMFKKKRLEWCDSNELSGVIAALIKDAERHGRRVK